MIIPIAFPKPDFNIRNENGKSYIWDTVRKKFVLLTPEEWVRQNFMNYLVAVKNYPASLFSVEKELMLGSLRKRYDLLVYKNEKPWMMVECKEAEVAIDTSTLEQILRYNMALPVPFLVLTNGLHTFCIERDAQGWKFLEELPGYF